MSDSLAPPWSDNPNAPQISYDLYFAEKSTFAGFLICTVFYGIVTTLFFQCMSALFNPTNRMKVATKWGLVAHTTAMFLFASVAVTMAFHLQFISGIDNREFPGVDGVLPPGPFGYKSLVYSEAITIVPNVMFPLNQWLADGLLLYRCCVVYGMKYWVIAFPCLMYLACIAMGILFLYETALPGFLTSQYTFGLNVTLSYFSISLALNVLLTLMIVARLVWHSRNIRNAMGTSTGATGLYRAVVTMLVESYTLYAVTFLLYLGPVFAGSSAQYIFGQVVGQVQVIAPFLIILRVANRRALTSHTIASGNIGSIHFNSRGSSTGDDGAFFDGNLSRSMEMNGEAPHELGVEAEIVVEETPS